MVLDGDVLAEPELLLDRERIWLVLQLGEPVAGAALEVPAGAALGARAAAGLAVPAGTGPAAHQVS